VKKKLALLFMFLFTCLTVLAGCNLFDTNNYASLSSVVATSGSIEITREQLINAYNSSGYYYDNYYGYTREEALKRTITDLVNRQYLLNYIAEQEKLDTRFSLTEKEKYDAIKETWDYVDSSIANYVKQVRKDLNLSTTDLSTEDESSSSSSKSEYSAKTVYSSKFEQETSGRIIKKVTEDNDYVPENKTIYDYRLKLSSTNKDYENLVWTKYITTLKKNQSSYNYSDTSDKATFNRELEKIYKTNIENAKLQKFEDIFKDNFGLDYDKDNDVYYVNNKTLLDIIEKYSSIYNSNKELYNLSYTNNIYNLDESSQNEFYNTVTNSSSRENYYFYGSPTDDETLLTCVHILVKFTETQKNNIENYKNDPLVQENLAALLANEKSQEKTLATERDAEGKEIEGSTIDVKTLFNKLSEEIDKITVPYSSSKYIEEVVKVFDKYIYTYNQDSGIMNAKFDYVVGTKTSGMVASFTEVVRKLYNEGVADYSSKEVKADYNEDVTLSFPKGVGYAGAISAPFLEEASNYSGYHIVLFTGTLKNTVADTLNADNVYAKLGSIKTSYAYGQSIFENVYDKVAKDNYSKYQSNLLKTISKDVNYNTGNFSDMY